MTDANWRLSIQDIARSINVHRSAALPHLEASRKFDEWTEMVTLMEVDSPLLSRQ